MVDPAPIIDTFPVLVIDTTPEDKVEKVNEAVLLEARDIVKSGSVKSFVMSGAEITGSALIKRLILCGFSFFLRIGFFLLMTKSSYFN